MTAIGVVVACSGDGNRNGDCYSCCCCKLEREEKREEGGSEENERWRKLADYDRVRVAGYGRKERGGKERRNGLGHNREQRRQMRKGL